MDPTWIWLVVETGEAELIRLPQSQDADCSDGWYLEEAAGQLRLCARSCALVASDPAARLRLLASCSGTILR